MARERRRQMEVVMVLPFCPNFARINLGQPLDLSRNVRERSTLPRTAFWDTPTGVDACGGGCMLTVRTIHGCQGDPYLSNPMVEPFKKRDTSNEQPPPERRQASERDPNPLKSLSAARVRPAAASAARASFDSSLPCRSLLLLAPLPRTFLAGPATATGAADDEYSLVRTTA